MLLTPVVSRLAKLHSLLDPTGPRKVHKVPVPRIGGIAFVVSTLALVVPVFFLNNDVGESFRQSRTQFVVLLTAACFMFAAGLIDDLRRVRGFIKLMCLVAASLAICASGATLRSVSVGELFEFETGWAAWPLTVSWILIVTVCMSVIDGLDGLAAGVAAMVCGTMVVLALWSGQVAMAVLMLALLGSLTGFLFFNFYPARIFMGDCGAMFIGFIIGAGTIVCQMKTSTTLVGLAVPFLAMGVPILDTSLVIVCRHVIDRRSMLAPDRNHLHHRLLDLGLNHRTAVIVIYAATAVFASIGVLVITADGTLSLCLLAGGLMLLFSLFACLHGGRLSKLCKGVRRNWALARHVRAEKRDFENAQLKMRQGKSFNAWWRTVCGMAEQMSFQSVGLWKRQNGSYETARSWNARPGVFTTTRTAKINLPFGGGGAPEWELRARIEADGDLELCGRQVTLLARLIDEFALPEQEDEAQAPDRPSNAPLASKTTEETEPSSAGAMTTTRTLAGSVHIPTAVEIMGIPVVPFESYDQALQCPKRIIESDGRSTWVAINPVKIYHAWKKPELLELLRQVDVGICDGIGVSITSKILYGQSVARCTGCDLFFRLLSEAQCEGWGIYLLGASAQSNADARAELQRRYPDLKIVGWRDGYFQNSSAVIRQINSSGAKILFVAMGSPKQEQWICRHSQAIEASICVGVGGSFDIASGHLRRAPKVFRMTGTEFLYRLMREPSKRWRIQKVLLPYFARVMGKKAVDLTLSDEDQDALVKHRPN